MKAQYLPTFLKDLKRLKGSREYEKIRRITLEDVLGWDELSGRSQVKKLSASDNAYRLRIGDYRIGFFWDGSTITFARVLHRREIYRFFPPE